MIESEPVVIPRASWLTLAVVSATAFMVSAEVTIIALALPKIRDAFPDVTEAQLSWVVTAYNIGVASLLLVSGWLADRYGRKRLFMAGLAIFLVGSVMAGLANSPEVLIAARAVQSLGGAAQFPAGLALILAAFPPQKTQTAIGIWGAMGGLAAAVGPTLGALLVDGFGWRAVFLVNVPIAFVTLVVGPRWITESRSDTVGDRVDFVGVPLASVGVGVAILGITQGDAWGWGSPRVLVSFVIGALLVAAFVMRARQHPAPLFDLSLYRHRSYRLGSIGTVFFSIAFFSWLVPLPTYIQSVWGWSVLKTGFGIAPGPLLAMVVSPVAGMLAERIGNGKILAVGGVSGAIGLTVHLAAVGLEANYVTGIVIPGLFIGVAAGCGFAQLVGATMRDVPPGQFAMGGAGRTTVFQLATAVGIALAFTIIGTPSSSQVFLDGIRVTWVIGIACYLAQALIFGLLLDRSDQR